MRTPVTSSTEPEATATAAPVPAPRAAAEPRRRAHENSHEGYYWDCIEGRWVPCPKH